MSKILIFAGTTEGRRLAEILSASEVECDVFVATEYGSRLIDNIKGVNVYEKRLDISEMIKVYQELKPEVVIDATHPYAKLVTENIKESLKDTGIKYLRLFREEIFSRGLFYDSISDCAKSLINKEGNILITTGSKEIEEFARIEEIKDRIYVRVIPGVESLNKCYEAGLTGKQIIAMQGPFSIELNEAIINQYDIKHLVTKSSGKTGGFDTKIQAALNQNIEIHIIDRPIREEGLSISQILDEIEQITGKLQRPKLKITLAGIGCGSKELMTEEVRKQIEHSDVIFGANRMLEGLDTKAVKYPYYLKEDIIPVIEKVDLANTNEVTILFSGDTGFYSGAKKVYEALRENPDLDVSIMPGISSISMLAARTGESWDDSRIISLHNNLLEDSKALILETVHNNYKTFFITSGVKDIWALGELFDKYDVRMVFGYRLSYEDEEIFEVKPSDCKKIDKEGLYAGLIINNNVSKKVITPSISDEEFLRDKVPMTKEEVRQLSVCRLNLKKDSVVYDIGSGTGSVSIQIAKMSPDIRVYSIECKEEAIELTKQNIDKFNAYNVKIINAMAPEGLDNIEPANAAFIGGSRGNLKSIINRLYEINPYMRVVVNAVSMESICEMKEILGQIKYENLDISQVAVTKVKTLGEHNLLQAGNPVFIYSFDLTV